MSKEGMSRAMFSIASPLVRYLVAFVVCSISVSADTEAFEETKELAEQGDARAQNKLGLMYGLGQGVLRPRIYAL